MKFDREWTQFAVDAEFDHFGAVRITKAHNEIRSAVLKFIAATEARSMSPNDIPIIEQYNACKYEVIRLFGFSDKIS